MSMTAAQHQRQQDDHAEIEALQEQIEQEMREELLAGDYYELEYRQPFAPVRLAFDNDNVIDQMIELDSEEFNAAVLLTSREPLKAAMALHALRVRAVEQVIGTAKTREAAEFQFEQESRRKAA